METEGPGLDVTGVGERLGTSRVVCVGRIGGASLV